MGLQGRATNPSESHSFLSFLPLTVVFPRFLVLTVMKLSEVAFVLCHVKLEETSSQIHKPSPTGLSANVPSSLLVRGCKRVLCEMTSNGQSNDCWF